MRRKETAVTGQFTLFTFSGPGMAVAKKGPSNQYSRSLVPDTTKGMVFGTRNLKCWVLGPSGIGAFTCGTERGAWRPSIQGFGVVSRWLYRRGLAVLSEFSSRDVRAMLGYIALSLLGVRP